MYDFAFVKVVNGKSQTETFESANGAHVAMGIYAGQHGLNVHVHEERWRFNSKSVMYKGNNPMFNTAGYVIQVNAETAPDQMKKKQTKIGKRNTGKKD
jgi:hypothetical protein